MFKADPPYRARDIVVGVAFAMNRGSMIMAGRDWVWWLAERQSVWLSHHVEAEHSAQRCLSGGRE
jgi:hypothetical protein